MKIDFSSPILDLDGKPLADDGGPVTLATLAINALLVTLPERGQPEQLDGMAKVKNATLAQSIHSAKALDLEAEQVALLKERIGRAYQPLAVMQAWNLLEGKPA